MNQNKIYYKIVREKNNQLFSMCSPEPIEYILNTVTFPKDKAGPLSCFNTFHDATHFLNNFDPYALKRNNYIIFECEIKEINQKPTNRFTQAMWNSNKSKHEHVKYYELAKGTILCKWILLLNYY